MKSWISISFIIMVLLGASIASASDLIILGNDKTQIAFTRAGVFAGLWDRQTDTTIMPAGEGGPAWRMSTVAAQKPTTFDSTQYPDPAIRLSKNSAEFVWNSKDKPEFRGTVSFDPVDNSFRLSIYIKNPLNNYLGSIAWPVTYTFAAKHSDYVVYCCNTQWATPLTPLDEIPDEFLVGPGYMFMQMLGFKTGNSSLLMYTNDTLVNPKSIKVSKEGNRARFDLSHLYRIKPGISCRIPYETVLKVIPHGDYNTLAQSYASWARKQWWAKDSFSSKLRQKPGLANYTEDGFIRIHSVDADFANVDDKWVYTGPKDANYFGKLIKTMTEMKQEIGIQPGLWDPVWHGKLFDSCYPDYFPIPEWMGNFDEYRKELTNNRWPMMYHVNPVHWSKGTPSYKRELMIMYNGNYLDDLTGWTWFNLHGGCPSLGLSFAKDRETLKALGDKSGFHGFYLDEIGHTFAEDENPADPYNGLPNGYQKAMWDIFKEVHTLTNGPIMTEGGNEYWLPYVDFFYGTCGDQNVDQIPLFEMIYGDKVARFTGCDGLAFNRTFQNHTWLIGGIIGMQGETEDLFELSNKQRVVSYMVGKRLLRFDRYGDYRISNWKEGIVIWRKPSNGSAENIEFNTLLGNIKIKGIVPDGCIILTGKGEFSFEGVESVTANGRLYYETSNLHLSCSLARKRYVFRNVSDIPQDYTVTLGKSVMRRPSGNGNTAKGKTSIKLDFIDSSDNIKFAIPARDALVCNTD